MSVRQEVPMTTSLEALQEKRDQLTESLAQLDDWRPGFLTARFRKCGKANCHCAQKGSPGHGPSYSLTPTKIPSGGLSKRLQGHFVAQTFQSPDQGSADSVRVDTVKVIRTEFSVVFLTLQHVIANN